MPDGPNILSLYSMSDQTDYAQQTEEVNTIADTVIREEMRIVCYNQSIYEDFRVELDEYAGISLGIRDNSQTTALTNVDPMYDQASILIVDNDSEFNIIQLSFY